MLKRFNTGVIRKEVNPEYRSTGFFIALTRLPLSVHYWNRFSASDIV